MNSRGISPVLAYVLTLGIITLLVSGLFIGAGDFVENQHERAIRSELEVVGNRLAADIATVDRLAIAGGSESESTLRTDLPSSAAGQSYEISISDGAGPNSVRQVNLTVVEMDISVTVRVKTRIEIVANTVSGGSVNIVYNGSKLEVRDV